MDREAKLDSIRDLEKQIQDHERAIIQLKRARNSLLNVSTHLPPEILGDVFLSNVIPDRDFSGLAEGSYDFLLVCHHWYNVALRPPELWSSWGNTIRDWSRRYARCGSVPLDLVLSVSGYSSPSWMMLSATRSRIMLCGISYGVFISGAPAQEISTLPSPQ